jgi:hypothetical protein
VLYLQQELAKQQTLEQQRFKQALEKQRLETQMAASEKVIENRQVHYQTNIESSVLELEPEQRAKEPKLN